MLGLLGIKRRPNVNRAVEELQHDACGEWLLNQAADLHVAAQTLNYAGQYTGERLHYDYLDRIEPSEEAMSAMRPRLTTMEEASDNILARLSGFLENVAAQSAITTSAPVTISGSRRGAHPRRPLPLPTQAAG